MSSSFKNNTTNVIKSSTIGTRILAEVPIGSMEAGTTAGDVLRNGFSGATSFYFRAGATSAAAARVFGVVESIQDKSANVVLQGLINYPSTLISGAPTSENFFLSAATAGKIQSYAPAPAGQISKKVLQQTTVGSFNATVIGASDFESGANVGEVQASKTSDAPVGTVLPYLSVTGSTATIPEGWVDGSTMQYLSVSEYDEYNTQFGDIFGFEETLTLSFPTSEFAAGLVGKQVATDQPHLNKHDRSTGGAIVTNVDTANNKLTIRQNKYDRSLYASGITAGSTPLYVYGVGLGGAAGGPGSPSYFGPGNLIGYISSGVHDKNATPMITHNQDNLAEPFSLAGYYPLYSTPGAAAAASPDGSGYHIHGSSIILEDGSPEMGSTYGTYYMPNGLKLVRNIGEAFNEGLYDEDELQYHAVNGSPLGYLNVPHDGSHSNPVTDYSIHPTGTAIQTLYTMKVKNVVAVDIPSQVTIQTLNVTHGLSAGSSANNVVTTDVAYDVQCLKNRIRDLEIRIMGSEQGCSL